MDRKQIVAAVLLCAAVAAMSAIGQNMAPPKYEVSSIRPSADNDFQFKFEFERDGTMAATGVTLRRLVMTAYQLAGYRIYGGPDWVSSKRWDVQAKGNGARSGNAQIWQMLRTLLEDRFQLRAHLETRNLPVYELTVGRKGSKLQAPDSDKTHPEIRTGNGFIEFTQTTVATFASQLSYAVARPVIDKTGIPGEFSFNLKWTPAPNEDGGSAIAGLPPGTPAPVAAPDGPSIFTAIEEQLGLHLNSTRGPVEVLVIDGVQMPADN